MTPEQMAERVNEGDRPTFHPSAGMSGFDGATITWMETLDPDLYDEAETGPMFVIEVEGFNARVHAFADEVLFSPTREVHAYDDEVCVRSSLHHGEPVCIHGYQLIEVWVAT